MLFNEAQNNLFVEVVELTKKNGQDESAAFDAEAKCIQPPIHQALYAKVDIRVLTLSQGLLSQGISGNESYVTIASRNGLKSLLTYLSVPISSEINPRFDSSAPDESYQGCGSMEDPRIIHLRQKNPCQGPQGDVNCPPQDFQEEPQVESRNSAPRSSSDSFFGEGPLGKKRKKEGQKEATSLSSIVSSVNQAKTILFSLFMRFFVQNVILASIVCGKRFDESFFVSLFMGARIISIVVYREPSQTDQP